MQYESKTPADHTPEVMQYKQHTVEITTFVLLEALSFLKGVVQIVVNRSLTNNRLQSYW